jgi:hypothetical protein
VGAQVGGSRAIGERELKCKVRDRIKERQAGRAREAERRGAERERGEREEVPEEEGSWLSGEGKASGEEPGQLHWVLGLCYPEPSSLEPGSIMGPGRLSSTKTHPS